MRFFKSFSLFAILAALILFGFACKSALKKLSQSEITKVSRTEYKNYQNSYTLSYPSNWQVAEYSDASAIVGFIAPDNPATPGYKPKAEISVIVRDNLDKEDIKTFYAKRKEDIFTEAANVSGVSINGMKGYFLSNIPGEITVDLTVLAVGDKIIEFELVELKYKDDYDFLIRSFFFIKTIEKQYRNNQMRYSVQIPSDWYARDIRGDGTVIGFNPGPVPTRDVIDNIRINVNPNPNKLSVEEFYRQPYEVQLFEDAKGGVESAKVNGRDALRFKDVIGLVNYEIVVFALESQMIEIELSQPVTNKAVFERMLRTLNFVPIGWKMYENSEWKTTFIYPETWDSRTINSKEELLVVAHNSPLPPPDVATEIPFTVLVNITLKSLTQVQQEFKDGERLSDFQIGSMNLIRYRFYDELAQINFIDYIHALGEKTIIVTAPEDFSLDELKTIITSVEMY